MSVLRLREGLHHTMALVLQGDKNNGVAKQQRGNM